MPVGDILYFAGDLSQVEFMGFSNGLQLVTSETEEGTGDRSKVTDTPLPIPMPALLVA